MNTKIQFDLQGEKIMSQTKDVVILKDIHCPYCDSENALLVNRAESKKISLQLPAYGLKTVLSLIYLSPLHIWVNGYKIIEAKQEIDNVTYGFCPHCGNGYSMAPPEYVKEEIKEPRFCKVREGKVIMGMCKGISEYTGISILWVRILTFFYGLTVIGALLYFLVGACVPFKDEIEDDKCDKRFYRIRKGKDVFGLCKGFSEYSGIPVMWVRIFTLLGCISVVGGIIYIILSIILPYKEDVEQGIIRKRVYKTKDKKVLLGVCSGIAKYKNMPLWLVRLLSILLGPLYFLLAAIIPTEED